MDNSIQRDARETSTCELFTREETHRGSRFATNDPEPWEIQYYKMGEANERPSYGDKCPAWMLPETHPDYRQLPKVVHSKPRPKDKAFDYLTTFSPSTIDKQCARLKKHSAAKTWKGDLADAPPSGQDKRGPQVWHTDNSGGYIFNPLDRRGRYSEVYNPDTRRYEMPPSSDYGQHGLMPMACEATV